MTAFAVDLLSFLGTARVPAICSPGLSFHHQTVALFGGTAACPGLTGLLAPVAVLLAPVVFFLFLAVGVLVGPIVVV